MITSRDPDLAMLASVTSHLSSRLADIGDEHWQVPTPCEEWDLRGLVDHVTGGNWFTVAILSGASADDALSETMGRCDRASPTVAEAIQAATLQLDAFQQPRILEHRSDHVAGTLEGREILRLRLHDLIVHVWDIDTSRSTTAQLPHDFARWGIAELSRDNSLSASHFGLIDLHLDHDDNRPDLAYLAIFGRTPSA